MKITFEIGKNGWSYLFIEDKKYPISNVGEDFISDLYEAYKKVKQGEQVHLKGWMEGRDINLKLIPKDGDVFAEWWVSDDDTNEVIGEKKRDTLQNFEEQFQAIFTYLTDNKEQYEKVMGMKLPALSS